MAPEQLGGKSDARSDLFAFGAVLHEMATGRRAFGGDTAEHMVGAILRDQPPPASSLRPELPAALDHVIALCLAKDPEERWQSARNIRAQLDWLAPAGRRTTRGRTPRRRVASRCAGPRCSHHCSPPWRSARPRGPGCCCRNGPRRRSSRWYASSSNHRPGW